jgi:glucose/arabinose dehydrogenase
MFCSRMPVGQGLCGLRRRRKPLLRSAVVAASAVGLTTWALQAGVAVAADAPAGLSLELFADGFTHPVAIRASGDGSGRLFVVEQAGRIVVIDGETVLVDPFLDISAAVESSGNEQGLLGLVFHPDYGSNGFFFVDYTYDAGAGGVRTRIARFSVSDDDPNLADSSSGATILDFAQPASNHNGGELEFGPDGYLYIATGDGGGARDPDDRAQNLGSLLGKILRINVDGASPYEIPSDNPFATTVGARTEIWAYGLRNPWRFSFDRRTGDVFIGDVGQGDREEIDLQPRSSPGGENYGWSCMEGNLVQDFNPCDGGPLTLPILVYDHGLGCAVTGGYRYRGRITGLYGSYLFGDFCSGRIWIASQSGGAWESVEWADTSHRISSFGEDEDGELYVLDHGAGEIYRFSGPVEALYRRSTMGRVRPVPPVKVGSDSGATDTAPPPPATGAIPRRAPPARPVTAGRTGP